ncbi:hypothetical protein [Ilumatobacter nonamiensis]|uniref:hypothetical protein n=1 Tax=Ilumatobacter nonamiensis TaxID=467093 RepID=UPI000349D76C|nr:hypothetical protein [Ilumatobacter nonamiensis]
MTTTLIARSLFGRARTDLPMSTMPAHACASVHVPASAPSMSVSPAAVATTTEMNLWLGGDVQGSGFGSKYATKRIAPRRLEGMT